MFLRSYDFKTYLSLYLLTPTCTPVCANCDGSNHDNRRSPDPPPPPMKTHSFAAGEVDPHHGGGRQRRRRRRWAKKTSSSSGCVALKKHTYHIIIGLRVIHFQIYLKNKSIELLFNENPSLNRLICS